jgi:hypothetical protein
MSWQEPNLLELQKLIRITLGLIMFEQLVVIVIDLVYLLEVRMDDYSLNFIFIFNILIHHFTPE